MKKLMTTEQLEIFLRISPSAVRNRLSTGESMPKNFKFGRRRLYREEDVEFWLESFMEEDTNVSK